MITKSINRSWKRKVPVIMEENGNFTKSSLAQTCACIRSIADCIWMDEWMSECTNTSRICSILCLCPLLSLSHQNLQKACAFRIAFPNTRHLSLFSSRKNNNQSWPNLLSNRMRRPAECEPCRRGEGLTFVWLLISVWRWSRKAHGADRNDEHSPCLGPRSRLGWFGRIGEIGNGNDVDSHEWNMQQQNEIRRITTVRDTNGMFLCWMPSAMRYRQICGKKWIGIGTGIEMEWKLADDWLSEWGVKVGQKWSERYDYSQTGDCRDFDASGDRLRAADVDRGKGHGRVAGRDERKPMIAGESNWPTAVKEKSDTLDLAEQIACHKVNE